MRSTRRSVCSPALLLALAACSSTTIEGTWTRPEFTERPIQGRVLVVGVARDETVRRVFEDEMASRLAACGIVATRSYEALSGPMDRDYSDRLMPAARQVGARYLLSTALIGQEIEQVVTQDPLTYQGPGYRGWYRSYWDGSYAAHTEIRTYRVYIAQTSLTDVDGDRVEWTARTRTNAPSDVLEETRAFAGVIVDALAEAKLIGPPK